MKTEEKTVSASQLKVGDEIKGYESRADGHYMSCWFRGYVASINKDVVEYHKWTEDGAIESVSSQVMFLVDMSEEEFCAKYATQAKEAYDALHVKLSTDELGEHEYDNGWISYDMFELARNLANKETKIVGVSSDILPKYSYRGTILDIGICAEELDGTRCWCHYDAERLNSVFENYERKIK